MPVSVAGALTARFGVGLTFSSEPLHLGGDDEIAVRVGPVPDTDVVRGWRAQQERTLRRRTGRGMTDAAIGRFVEHYERLSRHVLADMPGYADLTIRLGPRREVLGVTRAAADPSPPAASSRRDDVVR